MKQYNIKQHRTIFTLLLLIITITITACSIRVSPTEPYTPEDAWASTINSVQIPTTYHVNYYSTLTNSGGTKTITASYNIVNENATSCEGVTYSQNCSLSNGNFITMSDIKSYLRNYTTGVYTKYDNITCRYNITNSGDNIMPHKVFVCFDKNIIVSYGGRGGYGGIYTYWYIDGYYPNPELFAN
jgi:hypothetical protein